MTTQPSAVKQDHYQALYEVASTINSTLSLAQVLERVVESTAKAMGAKACLLRLLDPVRERLEFSAAYGLSPAYLSKGPVEVAKSGVDARALAGWPVIVSETAAEMGFQYPEAVRREGIASALIVPVTVKGTVIGVLRVYTAEPRGFEPDEIQFVQSIAHLSGIAIENARVYKTLEEQLQAIRQSLIPWAENFGKPTWR